MNLGQDAYQASEPRYNNRVIDVAVELTEAHTRAAIAIAKERRSAGVMDCGQYACWLPVRELSESLHDLTPDAQSEMTGA